MTPMTHTAKFENSDNQWKIIDYPGIELGTWNSVLYQQTKWVCGFISKSHQFSISVFSLHSILANQIASKPLHVNNKIFLVDHIDAHEFMENERR